MNVPLITIIREFEGCRLRAYLCPAGVWTCGWGSTGPDVGPDTVWTQEQANRRLYDDAVKYESAVLKISPVLHLEPVERLAAIADFAYNLGVSRYKASTLRKRVDAGRWDLVCDELQKWVFGGGRKLPGLVKRRQAEVELINSVR